MELQVIVHTDVIRVPTPEPERPTVTLVRAWLAGADSKREELHNSRAVDQGKREELHNSNAVDQGKREQLHNSHAVDQGKREICNFVNYAVIRYICIIHA